MMNIKYQFLGIIIVFLSHFCSASKYNITLSQLESCDKYFLGGTLNGYKDTFEVSSMKQNLKKGNERLHLKFYVIASNASNILLSESHNFGWNDKSSGRGYKIGLGDVSHYSVIYANPLPKLDPKEIALKRTPYIFPTTDPLPVEVIQTIEGELIVNVPGYEKPLLNYLDPNPVNIKFVRLGTFGEKPAQWFYNCKFDENSNKEDQNMCDCGVKNVSSINSGATAASKQEEQLSTSNLSGINSSITKLTDYFLSGVVPLNRHNSFCNALVPILDNFDDNQVIEFQQGVIELMKKTKNKNTPTTTKEPMPRIDVRIG